jgi:hypothetical protein
LVCGRVLDCFALPRRAAHRLVMGGSAFLLLMVAELNLSVFGFGRSIVDHFAIYRAWSAALGLAGQIGFALLPLVQMKRAPVA